MHSIFNSQIQFTLYQLLWQWMQKMSVAEAPKMEFDHTVPFSQIIQDAAEKYGLDPKLIASVIEVESNFNPEAESSAGAQGLMQLMPGTAKELGVNDPFNPWENVDGGVRYLRQMLNRFDGNIKLALAAYNAGPGSVANYGGIPPYTETQNYINRVLNEYQSQRQWSLY